MLRYLFLKKDFYLLKWGNYDTNCLLFCHRITAKDLRLRKSPSHKTNGDNGAMPACSQC